MFPISSRRRLLVPLLQLLLFSTLFSTCFCVPASQHYTYFHGEPRRWKPSTPKGSDFLLNYYIYDPKDTIDYLSLSEIEAAMDRCLTRWSVAIPLQFKDADRTPYIDRWIEYQEIRVAFDSGEWIPFNGISKFAESYGPDSGDINLNKAVRWAVDLEKDKSETAVHLESVLMHELGHVLGLGDSPVEEAIMYPHLGFRQVKVNLNEDDVVGIQSLYGVNPRFVLAPAPENSSAAAAQPFIIIKLFITLISLVVLFFFNFI